MQGKGKSWELVKGWNCRNELAEMNKTANEKFIWGSGVSGAVLQVWKRSEMKLTQWGTALRKLNVSLSRSSKSASVCPLEIISHVHRKELHKNVYFTFILNCKYFKIISMNK